MATWQGAGKRGTSVVPNNSRNAPDFGGVAEAVTRAANVRDFEHDGRERRGLCREVRRLRLALACALALNCTPRLPIMKNILAGLFVFIAANAFALDIITRDGKAYQDCAVKTVERDGVRVVHRDGTAFLDFDVLPSALQKQYGWTPEKSAARKAAQKAEADAQRIAGENARRAQDERAAAVAKAAEGEKQRVIAARERKDEEQQIAVGNARRAEEERVALSAMAGEQEKQRVRAKQVRLAKEKEKESEARAQDEKNTKILKWVGFGFLFVLGSIIAMWIARLPLCRVKSSP